MSSGEGPAGTSALDWDRQEVFARGPLDLRNWRRDELDGAIFDLAISNPPFDAVKRERTAPRYRGHDFEFHVIDIASEIAHRGVFILPQTSAPFRYPGAPYHQHLTTGKGVDFEKQMGLEFVCGTAIDTAFAKDQWKDTSIVCEIATVDFPHIPEERKAQKQQPLQMPFTPPAIATPPFSLRYVDQPV